MAMPRWLSTRLYFFGTRLYFWKRYGSAVRVFRLVAERGHRAWSPEALKWLGDSLVETGHIARAEDAYRRCAALRLHAYSADAAISLARLREEVQGDVDGAIDAYRTALRLGGVRALDPLISLLDTRGDKDAADALRAKKNIRSRLSAALHEADHHYADGRAKDFYGHVIAALDPEETVKRVAWALVDHEDWNWMPTGYLALTDRRLLLLDDFHYPNRYYGQHIPDYVLLSVDRADIDNVQESADAEGITVDAEARFSARFRGAPGPWIKALKPRDGG